jgi:hypothetical protein
MLATFAFDVCHDVYCAAREVIDEKIPTLNLESAGKYMWHPDRLPRLAEYVADFARAGERALESPRPSARCARGEAFRPASHAAIGYVRGRVRAADRDGQAAAPVLPELFGSGPSHMALRTSPSPTALRASRMAMFRVYYLGGAEYHAARRHLGISELTWADWAEEIRRRVGRELTSAGVFPPSKYFLTSSLAARDHVA